MKKVLKYGYRRFVSAALAAVLTLSPVMQATPAGELISFAAYADSSSAYSAASPTNMKPDAAGTASAGVTAQGEDPAAAAESAEDRVIVATATDMILPQGSAATPTNMAEPGAIAGTGPLAGSEAVIFSQSKTIGDVTIMVDAPAGVFPAGSELSVKKILSSGTKRRINDAIDIAKEELAANDDSAVYDDGSDASAASGVAASYIYDIKVLKDGVEIEPITSLGEVQVSFAFAKTPEGAGLTADIYHVKGSAEDDTLVAEQLESFKEETSAAEFAENTRLLNLVASAEAEAALSIDLADSTTPASEPAGSTAESGDTAFVIAASTDSFSYYVVEFTYGELQYVLQGEASVYLADILKALGIAGNADNTADSVSVSDETLIGINQETNEATGLTDYRITALKAFTTNEWMKAVVGDITYTIILTDSQDVGYFSVDGGTLGVDYKYETQAFGKGKSFGTLSILTDKQLTISGFAEIASVDRILVTTGHDANITIKDLNLNNKGLTDSSTTLQLRNTLKPLFEIEDGYTNTVELKVEGKNTFFQDAIQTAALCKNGLNGTLHITGSGSLNIDFGDYAMYGAAIGSTRTDCANIIIEMDSTGSIVAHSSASGAVIGSGGFSGTAASTTKNIEVRRGNIKAYPIHYGAGIGGGDNGNADGIKISGGTVEVIGWKNGGAGAGIGAGRYGNASNIEISGGTVTVTQSPL
ncbi:MAG: hypothetical protein Q4E57_03210 [Eubacteriales bacterium]|nr:hypothetical protein [Eubacteriales bacterium]